MNVLDLFSGIGGFSLGLERAGMRTVAFCEIDPYCRAVLAKRWPSVPCYTDIRELTADRLLSDGIRPDVICGGFPCQDISVAGKGAGLAGARSGLWSEYSRLIGELGPTYVIVENVSALLARGLDRVLGDLSSLGYDAEWHCIPASYVGAPHRRDRVWIIAYPTPDAFRDILWDELWGQRGKGRAYPPESADDGSARPMADTECSERWPQREARRDERPEFLPPGEESSVRLGSRSPDVADSDIEGSQGRQREVLSERSTERTIRTSGASMADDAQWRRCNERPEMASERPEITDRGRRSQCGDAATWWLTEPDVGRVAHGVPSRVDRLRALGNAVVPQIPEIIGRAIMTYLSDQTSAYHE